MSMERIYTLLFAKKISMGSTLMGDRLKLYVLFVEEDLWPIAKMRICSLMTDYIEIYPHSASQD